MGRKSTLEKYIGKVINGITILEKTNITDGRQNVKCRCNKCLKIFETRFHNVYRGQYSSCGCEQFGFNVKSSKWMGYGEISLSHFNSLKNGAKKKNLVFDITIEEIWNLFLAQGRKCALSGEKLYFSESRTGIKTASLDRIDPKLGYTLDNIQWVEQDLNYMKQSMDNKIFLEWVRKIYKYINND